MKKILFVALAAVGLAACVQNEELAVSHDGKAISFDNVYVENATKAAIDGSYTAAKGNLDHFNVWATISNNGAATNIFEGLVVENTSGAWTYDAAYTQYWIPGNHYEFVGVVDGNVSVSGDDCKMPVTIATNLSEQKDVLYATESRTYNGGDVYPVHLQFNHLLAKAKFTVKNTIEASESGLEYVVTNITIKDADKEAVYTIADGEWVASSTYDADFGVVTNDAKEENAVAAHLAVGDSAESNWERLILPQEGKHLTIVVNYELHKGDVVNYYNGVEKDAILDIEAGKAYNFVLALGNPGEPITFTAGVVDWVEENAVIVASADEFEAAFVNNDVNTIVLGQDLDINSILTRSEGDPTLTISKGKKLTIDLNGYKLSATSAQTGKNYNLFNVLGNLTINNGTIEYQHLGANMGWNSSTNIFDVTAGGVLNLKGVTAKNLGGSDMGFVAHLNNWGEVTLNVENSILESNYVAVRVFNSGPDMNNVTIKNSTLKGGSYAFWVHNYTAVDFGSEAKAEAQKALLNLNIYNQGNTFSPDVNGIRYGFTNSVKIDKYGITKSVSEDGTEVTLGYFFDDNEGLVRRGVAGDEENTTIKKVVVGEGIATLYDRTFRRFYALEEVVLPSTLTTIGAAGSGVFQSCTNLKSVVLPENLTVLGKGSFQECSSLESINIPAGVTRIEADALRATGLKKVVFHEGVTYFGAQAFRDCKQLTKVVIKAPEFTMENNTFGIMAAPFTPMLLEVANEEMKAYVESQLTNHAKTYITVVLPGTVDNVVDFLEAVKNVEDGGTITLAADINFTTDEGGRTNNNGWWDGLGYSGDKSFTIDLGGYTVGDANGALNDYLFWFQNNGEKASTITIKNGTLDAGTKAYCALCTASSNKQTLTVNVENVNLINNITNGSTVKVRGGSILNIKEGTKITGKNSYLGIECIAATVNIYEGAEIYMNGTASYNGCLAGVGGNGTVNVYGGYGKGVKGGFIAMTSGGTINVAGGEWIANTDGSVGDNSNVYVLTAQSNKYESGFAGPSIINVTGGTLRGGMDAWVLNNLPEEKAELHIGGGNFNVNPTRYLTEGVTATESNGIWTVQ